MSLQQAAAIVFLMDECEEERPRRLYRVGPQCANRETEGMYVLLHYTTLLLLLLLILVLLLLLLLGCVGIRMTSLIFFLNRFRN